MHSFSFSSWLRESEADDLEDYRRRFDKEHGDISIEPDARNHPNLAAALKHAEIMRSHGVGSQIYGEAPPKGGVANYNQVRKRVIIYADSPHYAPGGRDDLDDRNRKGLIASGHPDYVAHHELGHALHHRHMNDDFEFFKAGRMKFNAADAKIAGRVSRYATLDPSEFVAEVFAGLKDGKRYDPEIMGLYDKWNGPHVPES